MNDLQLIYNFIINQFNSIDLVNTISIVPSIDIDGNKENIYPLVNIDLIDSDVSTDAVTTTFKITVVQQREVTNKKTDSKLLTDTNYLDNVNETHFICQKFINYLQWQNNDHNIEIQNISRLNPLKNKGKNGLDGFDFEIDLSIFNNGRTGS